MKVESALKSELGIVFCALVCFFVMKLILSVMWSEGCIEPLWVEMKPCKQLALWTLSVTFRHYPSSSFGDEDASRHECYCLCTLISTVLLVWGTTSTDMHTALGALPSCQHAHSRWTRYCQQTVDIGPCSIFRHRIVYIVCKILHYKLAMVTYRIVRPEWYCWPVWTRFVAVQFHFHSTGYRDTDAPLSMNISVKRGIVTGLWQ
jgi:hypothetical protein